MRHLLATICIGLTALCHVPTALSAAVDYKESKKFRIDARGGLVPMVTAHTFQHAWVNDPSFRGDSRDQFQPEKFNPEATDVVRVDGRPGQAGLAVPLNEINTNIPAQGAVVERSTAKVEKVDNAASASSDVTVDRFAGTVISGVMAVSGTADAAKFKDAYAFSTARVTAQGKAKGTVKVEVKMQSTVTLFEGRQQHSRGEVTRWTHTDPIYFESLDTVTGAVLDSGALLRIDAEGDGDFDWSNDMLSLDVLDAAFSIDIVSPFTTEQGTLRLAVASGVVTSALATGMFSSLSLPTLGHLGAFTMGLRNDFTLNYDLDPGQNRDLRVNFDFSGGGSAYAAVPEPGTWALVALALVTGLAATRRRVRAQGRRRGRACWPAASAQ